jgi:hypothetical protein
MRPQIVVARGRFRDTISNSSEQGAEAREMKTLSALVCALLGVVSCAFGQLAPDSAAVPEPGTVILLGSALAGMGYFAWRRNRK